MSDTEFKTIELSQPIKRGDKKTIDSISVRKPKGGDLRGLSLMQVAQSDYDTIVQLLPRISDPVIHKNDINDMQVDDLMDVSMAVAGFFIKSEKLSPVTAP